MFIKYCKMRQKTMNLKNENIVLKFGTLRIFKHCKMRVIPLSNWDINHYPGLFPERLQFCYRLGNRSE